PGHAHELGKAVLRPVDDVAERPAEADGRVEGAVLPAREVEHVGDRALDDPFLEPLGRDALAIQLELARGEVGNRDLCAEPRELDREAAGPRADVEQAVARVDEAAQVLEMDVEARPGRSALLEARPLALAVLVVEGGGALG